ncbi:MAG: hypothetical protein Q8P20_10495 [bacterium]|nr:hypothetical protein [bacterium]
MKQALVASLNSGQNKYDLERYGQYTSLMRFSSIVKRHGGRIYVTGKSSDYLTEAKEQILQVCKYIPDVVYLYCGDGGTLVFLTLLVEYWPYDKAPFPVISLPKGGSFGILPNRLGIRDKFKHVTHIAASDSISDLTLESIKMMQVTDDTGFKHLSFSVGIGFVVRLLREAYRKKHLKMPWVGFMTARAIASAILKRNYYRTFEGQQRMKVETISHSDANETCEADWLGVIAHSVNSVGIPRYIPYRNELFWKAEKAENTFHAIGVDYSFRRLLWELPYIYMGEAGTYRDRIADESRPVLRLDKQVKSTIISADEPFEFTSCGELSFGRRPCITSWLSIEAHSNILFVSGDSKNPENE